MAESTQEFPRARPQVWSVIIGMSIFHIACFGALYTGVSAAAAWVAFGLYVVKGVGVTAGFHRLLAHRSYKANRVVQFVLGLAGSLAVQGGPLWWVAHHRHHLRSPTKSPQWLPLPALVERVEWKKPELINLFSCDNP